MLKQVIAMTLILSLLLAGLVLLLMRVRPDFSREGHKVLINAIDTGSIVQEEQPLPSWVGRKRTITVRYKDNLGVYHEQQFPENEISEINF